MNIEQFEREKYRTLWSLGWYRGPNAISFAEYLRPLIFGNCLDIGCGDCATMNELNNSTIINCVGMDIVTDQCTPGVEVYPGMAWEMPFRNKRFDFTFSTDVLEHLPTEFIEQTMKEIARVTRRKTFHLIATCAAVTEYKGEQVHLTVRPPEWWNEQFAMFCDVDHELKFW